MTLSMPKKLVLGMFETAQPSWGGIWAHPDNQSERLADPAYWVELARRLEDAKFDFLFLADSYGFTLIDGKRPDVAATDALDLPRIDPQLILAALSQTTSKIGLVATSSTTFEPPYSNARRLGSLDHLTHGRFGWNIVTTSFFESTARAFGTNPPGHDERYAMAEEHVGLVYRLLEDSWEDGALVVDRERHIFADPEKIHDVDLDGKYFRMHAPGNVPPSSQRTPVLFQAGSSPVGLKFGARHAEAIFLQGSTDERLAEHVAEVRALAEANGRGPDAIKCLVGISIIVGETTEAAQRQLDEFVALNTREAAIAGFATFTGINLGAYDPDTPMTEIHTEGGQSQRDRHFQGGHVPTVGEVIENHRRTMGARGLFAIGTVDEVADRMIELVDTTGIDGFLIEPFLKPGTARDVAGLVVPELQRRGRFRTEYAEDTLRERFFGLGNARLPASHPARQGVRL